MASDRDNGMQITITSMAGHSFEMDVHAGLTVNQLQMSIATQMDVGQDVVLSLVQGDRVLPQTTDLTLAALGIEHGSALTVVKHPFLRLLTASWDGTAKLWNPRTGECLLTLSGYEGGVSAADFALDGSTVLTVSDTVKI